MIILVYLHINIACSHLHGPAKKSPGGKQEEATEVLRKAVQRFLPKDRGWEGWKKKQAALMVFFGMKSH